MFPLLGTITSKPILLTLCFLLLFLLNFLAVIAVERAKDWIRERREKERFKRDFGIFLLTYDERQGII